MVEFEKVKGYKDASSSVRLYFKKQHRQRVKEFLPDYFECDIVLKNLNGREKRRMGRNPK